MEFNQICVLGLGYIGLPTASTFATHNLKVLGVDTNPRVVDTLRNGGLHIHEPGLRTLVQAAVNSGNLRITDTPAYSDAFIIAVPTPFKIEEIDQARPMELTTPKADLSYVISAAESIVPYLRPGNLVVLESTSPPRTTIDVVAPILETSGLKAGDDFYLVYSPERVLPGQILLELIENARVIGGIDATSAQAGRDLYATFVRGDIVCTSATTAEMVKLMENTYRDINIAIANEFSRLAERFGVDVWEAIQLANRHPRVEILRPGPGVGGHCISVDPWFLVEAAPELSPLIRTARNLNDAQPAQVLDLVQKAASGVEGKRIAILGLAYKPDVDDLRESPALAVARGLSGLGGDVIAYEPYKLGAQIPGVSTAESLEDALNGSDLLVLLVAHIPFKTLTPEKVSSLTGARLVVDTVNAWDPQVWEQAGFTIRRLGVGEPRSGW
jgi:UDP-N-acetyl-D-mannosaminuronic acid dehydrogenase